jgi:excisionase family DNA binding protein
MHRSYVPFEPLITASEAAQLLGIHPVTLLRWARLGRIPHCKLGRKVAFRASDLNAWCAGSTLIVPFVPPNPTGEGA